MIADEPVMERGDLVIVYGYLAGRPGPHHAMVVAELASGRVRVIVPRTKIRPLVHAIVDPDNLAPRIVHRAETYAPKPPPTREASTDAYVRFNF